MPRKAKNPCFILDSSLGKLSKWLRILGFDAKYAPARPRRLFFSGLEDKRIVLTRARKIQKENPGFSLLFIKADKPKDQLRQVIKEMEIRISDIKPFSRCISCNCLVAEFPKIKAREIVPDYVYETQETFKQCPRCKRIYWPGTHVARGWKHLQELITEPPT